MAGNVWEWCSTRWGGTGAKPKFGYPYRHDEREDLEGTDTRIVRGGSWAAAAPWCRCGFRSGALPGGRNQARGFRCARILLPS
jgi:iron(II)-dependent oxidoreductase